MLGKKKEQHNNKNHQNLRMADEARNIKLVVVGDGAVGNRIVAIICFAFSECFLRCRKNVFAHFVREQLVPRGLYSHRIR